MCVNCYNSNFVCSTCGTVLSEGWEHMTPYACTRNMLKELSETSTAETFVWFLKYKGKIVKIGFGSLKKLWKETLPNPTYCKFDSVFIYWCKDEDERNIFATFAMGNIEGIVNRKAVPNKRYIGKMDLHFKNTVSYEMRQYIIEDPDLRIGNSKYWDLLKLQEAGYVQ